MKTQESDKLGVARAKLRSDRFAIILTDMVQARMFLFFLERLEEVAELQDQFPGRIRFPVGNQEVQYRVRYVEYSHQYFDNVTEAALRWLQREAFKCLII